jgi:branched-subunit amino acid permease
MKRGIKRYKAYARFFVRFLTVGCMAVVPRVAKIWFETGCAGPLSYGRVKDIIASTLFTGASIWMAVGVGGVDVFGAEAEADHAGWDAAQDGEML